MTQTADKTPTIETILHYYRYDLRSEREADAYRTLCQARRSMSMRVFDSLSVDGSDFYSDKIQPLDGQTIQLETKFLFENQWNTARTTTSESGLRVFDWAENIYPNKNLKVGMWLEQTEEMIDIRNNTLSCGYCGAQYDREGAPVFCDSCLNSEYLKEHDLFLLRLVSIADSRKDRPEITSKEKKSLLPRYIRAQITGMSDRDKRRAAADRAKIEKDYKDTIGRAKAKHGGFIWLLDHNININNCIYYDHTGVFSFGWKSPIKEAVRDALIEKLDGFPYTYKFND